MEKKNLTRKIKQMVNFMLVEIGKLFLRDRLAYLTCFRHVVFQEFMQVEQKFIWRQLMIDNAGLQYVFASH
jgi:hypothetical protein